MLLSFGGTSTQPWSMMFQTSQGALGTLKKYHNPMISHGKQSPSFSVTLSTWWETPAISWFYHHDPSRFPSSSTTFPPCHMKCPLKVCHESQSTVLVEQVQGWSLQQPSGSRWFTTQMRTKRCWNIYIIYLQNWLIVGNDWGQCTPFCSHLGKNGTLW